MRRSIPISLLLLLLLLLRAQDGRAASFTTIVVPGFGTLASRITPDGSKVVGSLVNSSGFPTGAYLWTAQGGLTMIGTPGDPNSMVSALGVSDDGSTVVGWSQPDAYGEAFIWDADQGGRSLGRPAGTIASAAFAISSDGNTIGGGAVIEPFGFDSRGVLWTREADGWSSRSLNDPSAGADSIEVRDFSGDGGVLVGTMRTAFADGGGRFQGFVWDESAGFRGLGGSTRVTTTSQAWGVSRDGTTVVGEIWLERTELGFTFVQPEAFAWDAVRGMRVLEALPFVTRGVARAASAGGAFIVGSSGSTPVIWDSAGRVQPISQLLTSLGINLQGVSLGDVSGISADGSVIIGTGFDSSRKRVAWVAVIPEPSSAALIAIGLAILGAGSHRRR